MMSKIPRRFYVHHDVVQVAQQLLGKILCTHLEGKITKARITETEAYCGRTDKACHAYPNRRTKRTETMYAQGGTAYVYLCYGIHHLFNIVTNEAEYADAVLVRAVEPLEGHEYMMQRRQFFEHKPRLSASPATLTTALGISVKHDKVDLLSDEIWLENAPSILPENIQVGTRVGIHYAQEDAFLPWRFSIKNNPWVSKGKGAIIAP